MTTEKIAEHIEQIDATIGAWREFKATIATDTRLTTRGKVEAIKKNAPAYMERLTTKGQELFKDMRTVSEGLDKEKSEWRTKTADASKLDYARVQHEADVVEAKIAANPTPEGVRDMVKTDLAANDAHVTAAWQTRGSKLLSGSSVPALKNMGQRLGRELAKSTDAAAALRSAHDPHHAMLFKGAQTIEKANGVTGGSGIWGSGGSLSSELAAIDARQFTGTDDNGAATVYTEVTFTGDGEGSKVTRNASGGGKVTM